VLIQRPDPGQTVTIDFANVTGPGYTTFEASPTGPPPPANFQVAGDYFELHTTAFFDRAEVCFQFVPHVPSNPPTIGHYVNGVWITEPTTLDPTGTLVCATVSAFSPFVLLAPSTGTDTNPPVIHCAAADGAWHADNVAIPCTARDDGSGLANPGDASFALPTSVPSGVEDPMATTGTHQVCDHAGNCATAGPIAGNKIDRKAPTLTLPVDGTVNATSAAGAVVTYPVSAVDGADPSPTVNCTPASGTTFAIGTTSVTCSAKDHVGNQTTGSFRITVLGAQAQLSALIQKVVTASTLSPTVKAQLSSRLQSLLVSFDPNNPAQRATVCGALQTFITAVRALSGHGIPPAQATDWISDATRIRTVLAC
jgi:hypothetical protein